MRLAYKYNIWYYC